VETKKVTGDPPHCGHLTLIGLRADDAWGEQGRQTGGASSHLSGSVAFVEALGSAVELRRDSAQLLLRQVGTPNLGRSHCV